VYKKVSVRPPLGQKYIEKYNKKISEKIGALDSVVEGVISLLL